MPTGLSLWLARLLYAALGALVGGYACWLGLAQGGDWPPYQAESVLLIDQTSDSAGGGASGEGIEIAQRALQIAVTREPIRSAAVARLDGDWSVEGVTKRVRVEVPEGAPMIKIVATDADPVVAANIADAFALEAEAFRSTLGGATVLAPAIIPRSPVATSYLLVLVAAMVGALLAGGAMWLADRFRFRIRSPRDAAALAGGLPLLGSLEVSMDGRVVEPDDHDWIFVRLMNRLDHDQRTVLFTAPQETASQADLLRRLLSSDLGATRLTPLPAGELPSPNSSYQLELGGRMEADPSQSKRSCTALEILDGPPVLSTPSTVLSSRLFDGVVLVLEAGRTSTRDADRSVALLREAGANLVGSVLINRSVRVPAGWE